uniref:Uncharacterized protein n=1 Tax=Oryzias latipes TaxID=8090 RepID=A0A3P9JXI0_ORYLA
MFRYRRPGREDGYPLLEGVSHPGTPPSSSWKWHLWRSGQMATTARNKVPNSRMHKPGAEDMNSTHNRSKLLHRGEDHRWQVGQYHSVMQEPWSLSNFNASTTTLLRTGLGFSPVRQVKIIEGTPSTDNWFQIVTGISGEANNWLLLVEQAANVIKEDCVVCMGPRPLLRVVPAAVPAECVADLMTSTIPFSPDCRKLDRFYPLAPSDKGKPVFDRRVAPQNFSCFVLRNGNGSRFIGNVTDNWCNNTQVLTHFQPLSRADIWIWCGTNQIFDRLPLNAAGRCALVTLILPVFIQPTALTGVPPPLTHQPTWRRSKRDTGWMGQNDPTYIDSLGVPRGVPESILLWITPNKNVDRINYIHYNVQKLGNYTVAGFEAVHEQLKATSLMAFQNRIALVMLLAEKSGVCGIFGDQCCTFIPNNTQAGGKLTVAIDGMRTLNKKMKDHSGVDTSMWDDWMKVFGPWKNLISSILVAVAVFTAILTLCGCCGIPCIRSLLTRLIEKAVGDKDRERGQYAMLPVSDPFPPPQLSTQFV